MLGLVKVEVISCGVLYLRGDETLQHVDTLHDHKGLQHLHLKLQGMDAKAIELREG